MLCNGVSLAFTVPPKFEAMMASDHQPGLRSGGTGHLPSRGVLIAGREVPDSDVSRSAYSLQTIDQVLDNTRWDAALSAADKSLREISDLFCS